MKKSQIKASDKYKRNNYDRISAYIPKGYAKELKSILLAEQSNTNKFIQNCVKWKVGIYKMTRNIPKDLNIDKSIIIDMYLEKTDAIISEFLSYNQLRTDGRAMIYYKKLWELKRNIRMYPDVTIRNIDSVQQEIIAYIIQRKVFG